MDERKSICFFANVPVILHTCQELRREGFKHYHKAFDSKWALNTIYFNFELDTLCFWPWDTRSPKDFFVRKLKADYLHRIQSIALKPHKLKYASKFPGLKEFIYVEFGGSDHKRLSSCSAKGGCFHTVEELLESNSNDNWFCYQLERRKRDFEQAREEFDKVKRE